VGRLQRCDVGSRIMQIGYGRIPHGGNKYDQDARLRATGCDWIVFDRPGEIKVLQEATLQLSSSLSRSRELVVCSLDRLAKNLTHLFELIMEFPAKGIHLISLEERWHLSPVHGQETLQTITDLARFRQKIATEKSILGLRSAESKERQTGRPRAIDSKKLAQAANKIQSGMRTVAQIAGELGVSPATLYRNLADLKNQRK
jgi:DNA invertase Pin-like site-specific DNA recombinase